MARRMAPRERPSLLLVGEAATGTGFARVAHSLLARLGDRYRVHHLGVNVEGGTPAGAWRTELNQTGALLAGDRLEEIVATAPPDLLLFCYSPRVLPFVRPLLERLRGAVPMLFYGPLDGTLIDVEGVQALGTMTRVVAYTPRSATVMRRVAASVSRADPTFRFPPVTNIPHGVDTGVFYPAGARDRHAAWPLDRSHARARAFGAHGVPGDAFVVLNANRNQQRKRLDLTLEGFAAFARGKRDAFLCLHCGRTDQGWDLPRLAETMGVADRVVFTTDGPGPPALSDAALRDLYTACDVGVNTCVAEGWGLVAFEHGATGAAQVLPRHTACEELWEGSAVLLPASRPLPTDDLYVEEQEIRPDDMANALEGLYADPEAREGWGRAAFALATDPRYDWGRIAEAWDALFREVLGE